MSGFKIHVTTQGREALPNADNTGTVPVTVASIGITAQAFDDSSSPTSLPGEIKRLATFSGVAVADDTIHITIRDDSADVYDMRGFGIYLADGTLAACYSQEDVILGKSALTMLLLSTDIRFVDVDATSIVFGDSTWLNPPGSETVAGVLKLSTDTQAIAGNDRATAVPPGALKAALDAWLGTSTPSAFIKGMLTSISAAETRLMLGLKGAALKDEGPGNGLDADTLDGYHAAQFNDAIANKVNRAGDTMTGTLVIDTGALGGSLGAEAHSTTYYANTGNTDGLRTFVQRSAEGSGWSNARWVIDRQVDATTMGFIQFNGSSESTYMVFGYGTTAMGRFSATAWTFTGAVYASGGFQPASSRELKTDFRPNPYGLDAVLQLETTLGKYLDWFNPDGRERVFLIAENIADVMPQVAAGEGIEATPPGESDPRKFKGYAIEQMLAVYAKAFQDLHAIVQAQGERIAALEQDA